MNIPASHTIYMHDRADYNAFQEELSLNWKKNTEKPVWMNEAAMRKVKKKHHSYIRYLNTMDGQAYIQYTKARNTATKAIRHAKAEYEKQLAKESKTNNKAVWRYVNSKTKTRSGINHLMMKDGKLTTTDQEKAERLSEQYAETFTKEDLSNMPDFPAKPLSTPPLESIIITSMMVRTKLEALRVDKSPGLDAMHPRILKELATVIDVPLAMVFTRSLDEETLPSIWKSAVISPIFKKGQRNQAKNYRPVSLTSVICKIMERIVGEAIVKHMKQNNQDCPEQHGFTPGKSTVTNLLEALNVWTEALQHNLPVDVIFLDYQKAFDTVAPDQTDRILRY